MDDDGWLLMIGRMMMRLAGLHSLAVTTWTPWLQPPAQAMNLPWMPSDKGDDKPECSPCYNIAASAGDFETLIFAAERIAAVMIMTMTTGHHCCYLIVLQDDDDDL
eukprot:scaffold23068_cov67-Skeletonema_dohrnii-CCMP3373.AAC.1